ncbi:MAG: SUMF1/EgtB/PvdO family nonheme iron enzyme [Proteobacteria bacterium]|nr:SUMF1/EgtB/PvdO family nonheme iron enzyme [Pseudomonadota bacterium]
MKMISHRIDFKFSNHPTFLSVLIPVFFLTMLIAIPSKVYSFDTLQLSKLIAVSLSEVPGRKYGTIAFSRIQGNLDKAVVNELIDYTENEIVQKRRFRVIDRSKLQLILREQRFNLSGMVSSDTYKELGKLLGVDLFVYGRFYNDTIVLKAIDVESSALVWADIFQLKSLENNTQLIRNLALKTNNYIKADLERLKANRINQISFWSIKSNFDSNKLIDYLSVALTKDGSFQVVDRENLQLILEEQKLNMEDFIDEQKAKRMGELYGVDAFVYGRITTRNGKNIASLKMLNIYNGVIEWAKTISIESNDTPTRKTGTKVSKAENKMVLIPAGDFVMGSNDSKEISFPAFRVPLKAYYIDRTEVSNGDYEAFVKRYKHRAPKSWPGGKMPVDKEDQPVVMVNWKDANRYCKVQGKRLPKEVEWEKAFRGVNGRPYPWNGKKFYTGFAQTLESGMLGPVSTSTPNKDVSPYGVRHLAGNVREWVDSYLRPYPGSPFRSRQVGRNKVIRGGSWALPATHSIGWYRDSSDPTYGWKDVGFRCAKSAK